MNIQKIGDIIKNIFTLRTVWIDKGHGTWAVKKRFHPFLRSAGWFVAIIVCVGIYTSLNAVRDSDPAAEAKIITLQPADAKPEADSKQNAILLPLEKITKRPEIIWPSEENPDTDMIIQKPRIQPVKPANNNDSRYRITVNKSKYELSLYKGNELVKTYPVAIGKNPGDKQRVGDHRTPVGNFRVVSIENASSWKHDFGDGKGKISGAYGPWFLRLDAKGWKGIGIHGTHDPDSRGTNATEGCIRLSNEDIDELKQYAYKNMPVSIREN